jgi:acyl carrier protein
VIEEDKIFSRLCAVVRRTFRLADGTPIGPETTSSDIDGWDSLSHSILIMNVEDEFSIVLDSDRVYRLSDIGELAGLIRSTPAG